MSASSPSPNSPPQSTIPSSTPPPTPPSQPNANPPDSSNSTSDSPPPLSPPIAPLPPPPPPTPVQSPPPLASPPPATPPPLSPPLPVSPPPQTSVSPPASDPPLASPPPPASAQPPENPPPPPAASPPRNSPPQPASPTRSPPPPTPPDSDPPVSPPPPPEDSPPPPPPRRSPPPSPPPPVSNPTPPPENSPPDPSPPLPPQPAIHLSPPPPPPSSSRVPISPSGNDTSGDPAPNAPRSAESNGNAGIGTGGVAAIAAVAGILLLSLLGLVFWCVRKRRRKVSGLSGYVMPSPSASSKLDSAFLKAHSTAPIIGSGSGSDFVDSSRDPGGPGNSRPFFAFEELVQATSGFSAQNLLGEGGFGSVYKGYLPDGTEIAVKQLKIGGGQGEREFKAEVETISRVHHRHLVSLVGYCISDTRRLLVYNYVPNNNLYYHLHGEGRPVLEWAIRVKVAAGAARGIAYLHEDCHPRIIHRDIKSSNILLDSNFEARVSDFGLAKLALDADTHITTRVMGTFGYVAPEYASSGKLTDKSDVYSYGVVLLELITGRKPVDASQPLGDESLVEWARPLLSNAIESGEYGSLVDPKLESNYVETEMFRMIEIAAACVRHSSAKRPRMGQVVRAFDSLGVSDITNGMKVGESEVFNSAQQSEEIRWFRRMAFGSQDYSTDFFSQDSLNTRERPEKTMNESGL